MTQHGRQQDDEWSFEHYNRIEQSDRVPVSYAGKPNRFGVGCLVVAIGMAITAIFLMSVLA